MLMMRKISGNDQIAFQQFCDRIGTTNILENKKIYFGVFNNEELLGYTKIDLEFLSVPLIEDLYILKVLEPPIIEGLLRGTLHYCLTKDFESVVIRNIHWIKRHLIEALSVAEKLNYNNKDYYQINVKQFFNKPCKGRSMCL